MSWRETSRWSAGLSRDRSTLRSRKVCFKVDWPPIVSPCYHLVEPIRYRVRRRRQTTMAVADQTTLLPCCLYASLPRESSTKVTRTPPRRKRPLYQPSAAGLLPSAGEYHRGCPTPKSFACRLTSNDNRPSGDELERQEWKLARAIVCGNLLGISSSPWFSMDYLARTGGEEEATGNAKARRRDDAVSKLRRGTGQAERGFLKYGNVRAPRLSVASSASCRCHPSPCPQYVPPPAQS